MFSDNVIILGWIQNYDGSVYRSELGQFHCVIPMFFFNMVKTIVIAFKKNDNHVGQPVVTKGYDVEIVTS